MAGSWRSQCYYRQRFPKWGDRRLLGLLQTSRIEQEGARSVLRNQERRSELHPGLPSQARNGQVEGFSVTSISWSPDGKASVFDDRGKIFIYVLAEKRPQEIASGTNPEWSPDGKWISFCASDGFASAIDAVTRAPRDLFGHRKIMWGIHWSPDSRYVMLSEPVGFFSNVLHLRDIMTTGEMIVLRIEDGATVNVTSVYDPGIDDRLFYWVADYRTFLKSAAIQPSLGKCE